MINDTLPRTNAYFPSVVSLADDLEGSRRKDVVIKEGRSSQSAFLLPDPIIACIEARAAGFQNVPMSRLEPLQVVRYGVSDHFRPHHDWFGAGGDEHDGDRETTFFVYLAANCTGGATQFPDWPLPADFDDSWCGIIDCEESRTHGLTFNIRPRNALFWNNLDGDGNGIYQTLHAGLPLTYGYKIGLNIWTRQR